MITIIRNILDLMINFINSIFSLKIEFIEGKQVELGYIVVIFISVMLILYFVLGAVGISKKESDE